MTALGSATSNGSSDILQTLKFAPCPLNPRAEKDAIMDNTHLLIVAMAEECQNRIRQSTKEEPVLPGALRPKHLLWMCQRISHHAEDWPSPKLNRWLGFVQAAMMANQIVDFAELKSMFDTAKAAHGEFSDDFLDHLDPETSFDLDIGGQG